MGLLKMGKIALFFYLIYILSLFSIGSSITIMSVDFGSEWIKIAVVAPGVPMEIALNRESKRKTPAAISFRDNERAFGEDALTAGMRSPKSSYSYFLDLLGKQLDNPDVELFKSRFPYYDLVADPNHGTVIFQQDGNTTFSVEELTSQVLNYARQLANEYTNQQTKDLVVTVPPFFGQAERRALLRAADLADLKVLSLMSTNAAVALNYGMFRRKEINETAQNILFYDMGASFTTASIASYQTVKTKERGFTETNPQVTILGIGYDRSLGGLEMQLRVRDFLAKKFNDLKKTSNDVFKSPRAMAKLMKAAGKVKQVLSANTEFLCQVEGVLDDQDFSIKISRQDFEDLCEDMFERVRSPVDEALVSASIDIKDIHQFIIVGGNTRIPKIQSILQDIWGKELGKNINADEAAALGAVYRAADLGQGFKVMKFHVKESIVYPVEVDFQRNIVTEDGKESVKSVKRSLFAFTNQIPQKKVMTFNKHTEDFEFDVVYGDLSHLRKSQIKSLGNQNISHVSVGGVTDAFKKYLPDGGEFKGIKAHFNMDDSSILAITGIEALFEKNVTVEAEENAEEESTLSKIGSTISKLFSGSEGSSENVTTANTTQEEKTTEEKPASETDKNKNKTNEAQKEFKPKLVTVKEELNYTVKYLDLTELTSEEITVSKNKLKDIDAAENIKKEKEKSRNVLESYILEVQDKLTQEEYEAASVEEKRTEILTLASQLDEWLYEDGFDETPSVYKEKLKSLKTLFEPIRKRVKLHQERPEALKALHDMINVSSIFLTTAVQVTGDDSWFTDVEKKTLDELIINTQKWLEEKEEIQEQTPLYEDPVLTPSAIGEKISALDREVKYLVNKAKLAKIKRDKEEAEAKAKAEKEAKEAAKKAKQNKTEEEKEGEEQIEIPQSEVQNETVIDNDSRQEPPLPVEEESWDDVSQTSQENDTEENRRKDSEDDLDESMNEDSHTEL